MMMWLQMSKREANRADLLFAQNRDSYKKVLSFSLFTDSHLKSAKRILHLAYFRQLIPKCVIIFFS